MSSLFAIIQTSRMPQIERHNIDIHNHCCRETMTEPVPKLNAVFFSAFRGV